LEERNDLMKRGACFFCKEPGHRANECLKKKKNYKSGQGYKPNPKESFRKAGAKKVFTDIRALSTEQRNELCEMMISNEFDEEEDQAEEVEKGKDF